MKRSAFVLPLMLACGWSSVAYAQTYAKWSWSFDSSMQGRCTPIPPNTSCTLPSLRSLTGAGPSFQTFGRAYSGVVVSDPAKSFNTNGYAIYAKPGYQDNGSGYGFAWMTFVWLDQLNDRQAILWHEGMDSQTGAYVAAFSLSVMPDGRVVLAIGRDAQWRTSITSTRTIGIKSWHHVAFAWDTQRIRLLIDGIEDGQTWWPYALEESAVVPIMIGSYYYSGNPKWVLNGAVDELKLVQFPVTSSNASSFAFVLQEQALLFRKIVLDDMKAAGVIGRNDDNRFRSPTLEATSLLRAWVNSFFTRDRICLRLGSYDRKQDTVFPVSGNVTTDGSLTSLSSMCNDACSRCSAPATNSVYNSSYLNLRDGVVTGYCGLAAATLWGVYQAFGYPARVLDYVNDMDVRYSDSHSTTEVYTVEAQKFVMQDPTYNISGLQSGYSNLCGGSSYCAVPDLPAFAQPLLSSLPFGDGGYQFNADPIWPTPSPSVFFSYFKTPVFIVPAYQR